MRLSLGPNLFFWERQATYAFYERIAALPVHTVYLGETVCSKRRALRTVDWIELGKHLSSQGKEVVLSTLALIEAESELATLKRLCDNGDFLIEANDMAGVQLMIDNKLPFVAGPAINIYNYHTLELLHKQGLVRWVMPVELSRQSLAALLAEAKASGLRHDSGVRRSVEAEVFSYGKLPLAYSARCFAARAHNLPKDNCQFVCQKYEDGLPMHTQEKKNFLTINGIQTLSGDTYNLLAELADMEALGVDLVRLSPMASGMEQVIRAFDKRINGLPVSESEQRFVTHQQECDGYWHGRPGMDRQVFTSTRLEV